MRKLGAISILLSALLAGCAVHEFPETPKENPVLRLTLTHDQELPFYTNLQYTKAGTSGSYQHRHIVNVYEPESDGSYGRSYSQQYVFTDTDLDSLDCTVSIELPEGGYKFMVWTDFVVRGSQADLFYDTSDFSEIALTDSYEGCNDLRDAFRGSVEMELSEECDSAEVELVRPMAKYVFISEDLEEFITRAIAKAMAENTKATYEETRASINLDDYTVLFTYTGYMPCSYNFFTDRPADSATGMYYYGSLSQTSDTEAELGFDYVFVNGSETSVQVALYVYDKEGDLISSTSVITVPLKRSGLTTVRGEFLTSEASGGIGIDPSYDGDYNIQID